MQPPKMYNAALKEKKVMSPNTKLFTFELDSEIEFQPGQFMIFALNDAQGIFKRSFSIASDPARKKQLEFIIKIEDNGRGSKVLDAAGIGDKVEMTGSYGKFVLKKPYRKEIVFVAAGAGLAPIRSMLYELLVDEHLPNTVWFFFGFRTEEDALCKEELEQMSKRFHNFKLIECVSQGKTDRYEHLGRVTAIIPKFLKDGKDKDVYICGPPQMVDDTIKALEGVGFTRDAISTDKWG